MQEQKYKIFNVLFCVDPFFHQSTKQTSEPAAEVGRPEPELIMVWVGKNTNKNKQNKK